jgi:chitosanase
MLLTPNQRKLIERVLNVAETGKPDGDCGAIALFNDGPHDIKQVTYGRSQTTEYGNLRELVIMYVNANGAFSGKLKPYVDKIGAVPLANDQTFIDLLRRAGREDPVMQRVQDAFFAKRYFDPAMRWADAHGFVQPLSALVIYDSYIHSGSILWLIRRRFTESPPSAGGDEKAWISAYVKARHAWLSQHSRPAVRKSIYRTKCYLAQIDAENWRLQTVPIIMNGTKVSYE